MDAFLIVARRMLPAALWRKIAARLARSARRPRQRRSPVWSFLNIPAASRVDTVASFKEARKKALRPAVSPLRRTSLEGGRTPA